MTLRKTCLSLALLSLAAFGSSTALAADSDANDTAPGSLQPTAELVFEDFTLFQFPPAGWARIHEGTTFQWMRSTVLYRSEPASARLRPGGAGFPQDEYLVLPGIDFTELINPKLEWYEDQTDWATDGDHHYIMVSTTSQTDPAAFTPLLTMTPATHTINGFAGDPVIVDLSAYVGEPTVYIAFRYVNENGDNWYIDDVALYDRLAHDVAAVSIVPDGDQLPPGGEIAPVVTVANVGLNPEAFDVQLEIDETGTVVYTEIVSVPTLGPGESYDASFPAFTVGENHLYTLYATTLLPEDMQNNNDTAVAFNNSYAQPHVPLGLLFTNWGCGPCVPANQELDDIMPGFGNDAALIRIHVWWPSSNDPMYLANVAQCQALTNTYGVTGVPDFFMNGVLQPSIAQYEATYLQLMQTFSPNIIELAWNPDTEELIVEVDNLAPIEPGDYRLRSAITEDNIAAQGPNGEPIHNQAFRYMYPDVDGLSVPAALGTYPYTINCPLNPGWVYDNLRATVYIQNETTYEIIQSATAFLTEIEIIPLPVGEQVVTPFKLSTNYPNPFNPSTSIKFSLPSEQVVELKIFAVDGRLVTTLVSEKRTAGEHTVVWNGRDHTGAAVASGTYFYQLQAEGFSDTKRMVLVK
jgi:hypothetical protein